MLEQPRHGFSTRVGMAFKLLRIDVACPACICLGQGRGMISTGARRRGSQMQTVFQSNPASMAGPPDIITNEVRTSKFAFLRILLNKSAGGRYEHPD